MKALREYRTGLDGVARALLEKETIDGAEVGRLVDRAAGHRVRPEPSGELHVSEDPTMGSDGDVTRELPAPRQARG